jgi:hypothetical protein
MARQGDRALSVFDHLDHVLAATCLSPALSVEKTDRALLIEQLCHMARP